MLDYSQWKSANDANWYSDDPILTRYAARYVSPDLREYVESSWISAGQLAAGPMDRRAVHTDRDGAPKLIRYNREGEEINEIWYNEGYLQTVRDGYGTGVVAYRYDRNAPEPVPFFVNCILLYLLCEAETGFTCPVGLTQSVAFVLEKFGSEQQKAQYLSRLASLDWQTFAQGATFLTEIQGGSDVGATRTTAVKEGDHYLLTGEKWFASNCDAEIAITLARMGDAPGTRGLGLFLMPRTLPDGTRNRVTIRRLKDKLGVRAVASGELELHGAVGYLIGDANQGFKYMAEALNVSRLGTSLAGLAIARRCFLEAMLYAERRAAFGQPIVQYPMVRETLLQMMVEVEAGWAITAQTIRRFDEVHTYHRAQAEDSTLLRILLSLVKYRHSELGVTAAKRSMELHGGNGYIEEYPTARLIRDALVNPIWEGTANIQALEILKNLQRGGLELFVEDLFTTLDRIQRAELTAYSQELRQCVQNLEETAAHLLRGDLDRQQAAAKRLADWMYDVFSAVHLLEESAYDLEHAADARRVMVLDAWLNMVLRPQSDRGIFSQPVVTDPQFDAVVRFAAVAPNILQSATV
ncbi:acyl-CoA dehydrogenase [Alicyclobacillus contaminans]|uniref:acyl-CoA dehydrogenase family protein n=1 Tax=Alicyclobacillus contaminans TaxID=392016 RepID=UPI0004285ABE|nr:acyl-CoA dehydrogenase family protein [Alicyclobacillus contaminans]GMA48828.1 acyl-CoA dehydrogenase [Alicyclobacillus contaminans]